MSTPVPQDGIWILVPQDENPTLLFTPAGNGAAVGGGTSDHGALTGLADDDHTQYALADGTRGTFEAAGAVSTHAALTTGVHGLGGASQLNVGTTAGTVAAGDHAHTGTYQPLATVLTNTTAAFTTAQETKLSGIEAAADVTDAGNVGTAIDGATAKTTPVDADTVALIDSAAGNVLKKLSWANIKATAKTYFDTLYQAILVSGTNIKTVNSTSLLGSGDIAISASPAGTTLQVQYNNAGAFGGMNLWRESADISAFRNGTTAETVYVYKTYTDTSNYERLALIPSAATGWMRIAPQSAGTGAASISIAIAPLGNGAFSLRDPDSGISGGNARGNKAVDLQISRTSAANVASGNTSTIVGGEDSRASGTGSAVAGGTANLATGSYATCIGGSTNTASGTYSATAGGTNNSASGTGAFAAGRYNVVAGQDSWAHGSYATGRAVIGAGVYASGQRAAVGDRQTMVLPISCAARTDATPTVMTSDAGAASATNQMVLPNNSSMFFEVDVVAHDSTLKSASWKVQGTIRRGANAAATAIVGTNVTTTFGSDLSGGAPGVTCTADTTNGALAVTFTGIAATTIYPSGHIRTVIAA